MFNGHAEADSLRFTDRESEIDSAAVRIGRILRDVLLVVIGHAIKRGESAADAVNGVVRIEIVEAHRTLELAPAHTERQTVARTDHVVVLLARADDQSGALRVTERRRDAA